MSRIADSADRLGALSVGSSEFASTSSLGFYSSLSPRPEINVQQTGLSNLCWTDSAVNAPEASPLRTLSHSRQESMEHLHPSHVSSAMGRQTGFPLERQGSGHEPSSHMGFVQGVLPVQQNSMSWGAPAINTAHVNHHHRNSPANHPVAFLAHPCTDATLRNPRLNPSTESRTLASIHHSREHLTFQSSDALYRSRQGISPQQLPGNASTAYALSLDDKNHNVYGAAAHGRSGSNRGLPNNTRKGNDLSTPLRSAVPDSRRGRGGRASSAGKRTLSVDNDRREATQSRGILFPAQGQESRARIDRNVENQRIAKSGRSVREYNRRISACARKRDLAGALRILDELDRAPKVARNLFTYNAVINALVVCGEHSKAEEVWGEMQRSGIKPNLVTYNTMLKSCFGGVEEDVQRAFRMLKEMKDSGIRPDRVTLNSVINACVSAGKIQEAQGVFEEMRRLNIEPDAYTFCTMAKQARHQCDVSMLDALLLHQLHHHTGLLKELESACAQKSLEAEKQISPVAYNTIADAYIRCGYPGRAISLLERMHKCESTTKAEGQFSEAVGKIPVCPDVQTFNVRLKALRESGASVSEAFSAVEEMRALGLEPDHITFLTLADLCCRREEMGLAEGVLRSATQADIGRLQDGTLETKSSHKEKNSNVRKTAKHLSGVRTASNTFAKESAASHVFSRQQGRNRKSVVQPRNAKANAALFNALIRGYSALDPPNINAALALYMDMRRFVETYGFSWYAADSVTYTMLVDAFAKRGDVNGAQMIVTEMETAGRANVVAYNAYLKANRGKGYKAALSVLERMRRAGLRPDVVTYNTVIDFLSSEENGPEIAEELVQVDMPRNGVRPDLLTFNTLIKGVARSKCNKADAATSLQAAYRWLTELQSRGLTPDEFTYQSMVSVCAAAGDVQRALMFFRKVEAERTKRFGRSTPISRLQNYDNHGMAQRSSTDPVEDSPLSLHLPEQGGPTEASFFKNSRGQDEKEDAQKSATDWMLLPHPAAYIALMRAFLSSSGKGGVESVLLLRDEMVARGLELGRTGYTAVADAYAARGDYDGVEATFREMESKENRVSKLSPAHHCIRMKALCNAGRLDDAIAILPEVNDADTALFNQLIFACAKSKDVDRMIGVLKTMEVHHVQRDAVMDRALSGVMKNIARTLRCFDEQVSQRMACLEGGLEAHLASNANGLKPAGGSAL